MAKLRIAGLQTAGTPGNIPENLEELRAAANDAKRNGAALLITTEMFLTGYDIGPEALSALTCTDLAPQVASVAQETGIAILAGLPILDGGALVNAAAFFDENGGIQLTHSKSQLFGDMDAELFNAGQVPVSMVEFRGVSIAVLICYDVEFPEAVRAAALAGAHLIAVPTAQMEPFRFVCDEVIRVRAWENQVYVAYINHVGQERETAYVGGSSIVAPDGMLLDKADHESRLLYANLDTEIVVSAQRRNPYLTDLRQNYYPAGLKTNGFE